MKAEEKLGDFEHIKRRTRNYANNLDKLSALIDENNKQKEDWY